MEEVFYHEPVLLNESIGYLLGTDSNFLNRNTASKRVYVDCTLGGGGYTKKILTETGSDDTLVIAIDRDIFAIEHSKKVLSDLADRIIYIQGNFGDISEITFKTGFSQVDGVVLDLGLSSYQLNMEAGFSYQKDTALDMRADKDQKLTAADILNSYSIEELSSMFFKYGELRYSRQIAEDIAEFRISKKLETTFDLVEILRKKVPPRFLNSDLSRLFQAIRIEVNNELKNLESVLTQSAEILKENGRVVAVSYHSLEDRIVKQIFRNNENLKVLTKKPVKATEEEIHKNIRARSAKLRAAEKVTIVSENKNKYKRNN